MGVGGGEGAQLCPHLTFRHYELRRSLIAQSSEKSLTFQGKSQKFQFAVQIVILQENTFFDLPPPIVGYVPPHAHVRMC